MLSHIPFIDIYPLPNDEFNFWLKKEPKKCMCGLSVILLFYISILCSKALQKGS